MQQVNAYREAKTVLIPGDVSIHCHYIGPLQARSVDSLARWTAPEHIDTYVAVA